MKIGMVGVGLMGLGIASSLLGKGHELVVLEHPGNRPLDPLKAAGAVDVLAKGGGGIAPERIEPYLLARDTGGLRFSIANACKDLGYYQPMASDAGAHGAVAGAVLGTLQSAFERAGPGRAGARTRQSAGAGVTRRSCTSRSRWPEFDAASTPRAARIPDVPSRWRPT